MTSDYYNECHVAADKNFSIKLRKPKPNICHPYHLDGFSPEKEENKAKTSKELEFSLTLVVEAL